MPGWVIALVVVALIGAIFGVRARRQSGRLAAAVLCAGMVISIAGHLLNGRMSGDINHLAVVAVIGIPLLVVGCTMCAFAGGMLAGWAVKTAGESRKK
jgi:hypothetical protein